MSGARVTSLVNKAARASLALLILLSRAVADFLNYYREWVGSKVKSFVVLQSLSRGRMMMIFRTVHNVYFSLNESGLANWLNNFDFLILEFFEFTDNETFFENS